jgi:hypothetical protein
MNTFITQDKVTAPRQMATTAMKFSTVIGMVSSMMPMSLLKRLMIRPIGFVSKKRMGVHRTVLNICLCRLRDARMHMAKKRLDLTEPRTKTATMITV